MYSLTHIIYVSTCRLDPVSMKELVRRSRAANSALGITSVMVQCGDRLLQILEGNSDTLDAVYGRIAHDNRHSDLNVLVCEAASETLFENCPLGFTTLTGERVAYLVGAPEMGSLCVSQLNVGRAKRLLTAIANGSRAARTGPHRVMTPQRSAA